MTETWVTEKKKINHETGEDQALCLKEYTARGGQGETISHGDQVSGTNFDTNFVLILNDPFLYQELIENL